MKFISMIFGCGVLLIQSCVSNDVVSDSAISNIETRITALHATTVKDREELQSLYEEYIPRLLDTGRHEDALAACRRYLELFPGNGYNSRIREWMSEAKKTLNTKAGHPAKPFETQ